MKVVSIGLYALAVALVGIAAWYFMRSPSSSLSPEEAQAQARKNKIIAAVSLALGLGSGAGGYFLGKKGGSSHSDDVEIRGDDLDAEIDSI
jgi:hypothetical protein